TDCSQQTISDKKNVGQRRRHQDAIAVLRQAAVAHLGEAEDPLDHSNRMLDACTNARLAAALRLDRLIQVVLPLALPVGAVLGLRRLGTNNIALALVRMVAIAARILPAQKLPQQLAVRGIGW